MKGIYLEQRIAHRRHMNVLSSQPSARITVIDALRGFALFGLFIVHTLEHFDFCVYPEGDPSWLASLNQWIYDIVFFLFAGKAYAIFSMMFGLSFFIQMDRQARRGVDFAGRFGWRLLILLALGYVHGLFYCGDVLTVFALCGFVLLVLFRLPARALLVLSVLCILQIPFLVQFARAVADPSFVPEPSRMIPLFMGGAEIYGSGTLGDVVRYNTWSGQWAKWLFYIDFGRLWQIAALFIWGLLLGRARFFENYARYLPLCRNILWFSLAIFLLLRGAMALVPGAGLSQAAVEIASKTLTSYANIAQTAAMVALFLILYARASIHPALDRLAPLGKMSLTCYVSQSVVGTMVFYAWGFGMYAHWGIAASLVYGLLFFAVQLALAPLWLRYFQYGPLEWLWRCLTFTNFHIPLRRRAETRS